MIRWILIAFGAAVALVALVAVVGLFLPRTHLAASRARYRASAGALWATLADFRAWPAWGPGVRSMEPDGERDGAPVWVMKSGHGSMRSRVLEMRAPADGEPGRLVTEIDDDSLPYGGSWTWTVAERDGGSEVTITEDGFIENVVFRALARFVFGYTATQRRFLVALGEAHGERVEPERVR